MRLVITGILAIVIIILMALLRWENKPKQQFSAVHYNYEFLTGKNILPEDIRGFFFPLSSIKTEPYVSPHPKGK